jgi:undecaprenyl-diphosphatase
MLHWLDTADRNFFLLLNGLNIPFLDKPMWYISGTVLWLPFYAFLIYLLISKYKKNAWMLIPMLVLLIFLSDSISSGIIKNLVMRLRPSHEPMLAGLVHLVTKPNGDLYRGGLYGFVSSHAANTFAAATFVGLLIRKQWLSIVLIFWALLVSYSRIYLGVHYPGDILGGIIVGTVCGFGVSQLFNYIFYKYFVSETK